MWCAFSCLSDSLVVVATSVGAKPKHGFFHCQHLCATFFRLSADRGRRGNRAMRTASTGRAPLRPPESCARVAENTCFTRCFRMRRFGAALRASSAARRTTHRARRARAARAAEKNLQPADPFPALHNPDCAKVRKLSSAPDKPEFRLRRHVASRADASAHARARDLRRHRRRRYRRRHAPGSLPSPACTKPGMATPAAVDTRRPATPAASCAANDTGRTGRPVRSGSFGGTAGQSSSSSSSA